MQPNIPLNVQQLAFLQELDHRTAGTLTINCHDWMETIMREGGSRDIFRNENNVPVLYLRRFYLYRGPDREAMIHQFFLGDKGPLHDHPADSWGRIIECGYYERLCTHISEGRTEGEYEVDRKPGDWSYRPGSNSQHDNFEGFHKVKLRKPQDAGKVITFFVMEKRNPYSWGFRSNDGQFVPYDEMNKLENITTMQSEADDFEMGWFPRRKR